MAFFNQPNSVNPDISLSEQQYLDNSNTNYQDGFVTNLGREYIYSNLQPTAVEFQPSSSNNGAIRKPQSTSTNRPNKSSNYYGSGRTVSNSRNFRQRYEKSEEELTKPFSYDQEDGKLRNIENRFYKPNVRESKPLNNHTKENYFEGASNYQTHWRNPKQNTSKHKYKDNFNTYGSNWERFNPPNFSNRLDKQPYNNSFRKGYNSHYNRKGAYNKNYDDQYNTVPDDSSDTKEFTYSSSSKYNANFNNSKFVRKNVRDFKNNSSFNKGKGNRNFNHKNRVDAASQKERLEEMIYNRILECLVCCEKIKNNDKVWSCQLCYHIIHLHCVIAWAKSSKLENGWRCPACQNVCSEVPNEYKCYCGKIIEPKSLNSVIPHGCGEICLRKGRNCDHKCTLLCHPGPCPDCSIMVSKSCGCGATQPIVKCSTGVEIVCEKVCNKLLECGVHHCAEKCHSAECKLCTEMICQECYCGKLGRKVPCRAQFSGKDRYECEEICGKQLSCGNHTCKKLCHDGPCEICFRDIKQINTCPCGNSKLEKIRESCLDPIPCCNKVCGKLLKCGLPGFRHTCKQLCHEGDCPPCPLTTLVKCRCGHMDKELPCLKLTNPDDTRCEKKCVKKRLCGKHKCNQRCCIEIEHICPLPCNHLLSCGKHRCELTCHSGRCAQCLETSFEELYCECGSSVLYPPIPCGTKRPNCNKPCSRPRTCEHDVNHNCHTGTCPPCTVLCKKWCYGHHEQRSAILCHQNNFSCGLPCGKQMICGKHKCIKPCHDGPCPSICNQPCSTPRGLCNHICGKPCHDPPCLESACKQKVAVTCPCGLQKGTKLCMEVTDEFRNIEMAQMKEKMSSKDQAVDLTDIIGYRVKPSVLKILECNDECRVIERNRLLAIGLQIINPDLSQKLTPRYSDFMRQWAKKDSHFCQRIHDKLTDLVQLAKQSKQKSRSYSFDSMNKEKRHFIHEYCEHFGVESAAYDSEPNRNVVATAVRDKSWLPSMSLLEVIQRENGQRKVPGPISVSNKNISGKSETVSLKLPSRIPRPPSPSIVEEVTDYFNCTP